MKGTKTNLLKEIDAVIIRKEWEGPVEQTGQPDKAKITNWLDVESVNLTPRPAIETKEDDFEATETNERKNRLSVSATENEKEKKEPEPTSSNTMVEVAKDDKSKRPEYEGENPEVKTHIITIS